MAKIDIYLGRLSHFVQLGLFIITLWTLYYTVVPLYKSAQMEESLAKKELELEKIQRKATQIENELVRQEVHNFAVSAAVCVGIPEAFTPGRIVRIEDYPPGKVVSCILEQLQSRKFVVVDAARIDALKLKIYEFEHHLTQLYEDKLYQYQHYPEKVDSGSRDGVGDKDSYVNQLDSVMSGLGYQAPAELLRESNISNGRFTITMKFISEAGRLILKDIQL